MRNSGGAGIRVAEEAEIMKIKENHKKTKEINRNIMKSDENHKKTNEINRNIIIFYEKHVQIRAFSRNCHKSIEILRNTQAITKIYTKTYDFTRR